MSNIRCDLCDSDDYEVLYSPVGTKRNNIVCICHDCGLVFSIHDDVPYSREPTVSCDADWGNVRFCKGQRLDAIKSDMPTNASRVLDIGSSRGHFVRWYESVNPYAEITALEPDTRIADCPDTLIFVGDRLEDSHLPENYFDFIYCCQTLEHVDSATLVLDIIQDLLAPDGILFLEVPNIEVISYPNNTEEFFIDKHNYHFTHATIDAYLRKSGLGVIQRREDKLNVSVFARKTDLLPLYSVFDSAIEELILNYADTLQSNRERIPEVVEKITTIMDTGMKVAFWGANTMFDLLVKYGGLDTSKVGLLVDTYLCECVDSIHGVPVENPEELRIYQPDVVFILARFSADALVKKARQFGIRNVITFDSLL